MLANSQKFQSPRLVTRDKVGLHPSLWGQIPSRVDKVMTGLNWRRQLVSTIESVACLLVGRNPHTFWGRRSDLHCEWVRHKLSLFFLLYLQIAI